MDDVVRNHYASLEKRLHAIGNRVAGPLTLTEKILFAHLANPETAELERGKSWIDLNPDRVARSGRQEKRLSH
jgi:aconitate hydratase